jgi:hypothetical protein
MLTLESRLRFGDHDPAPRSGLVSEIVRKQLTATIFVTA